MSELIVYGADWCADCRRSKRLLDRLEVPYTWRDTVEDDSALAEMMARNGGRQSIPLVVLPNGEQLTEPSDPDLRTALVRAELLAAD